MAAATLAWTSSSIPARDRGRRRVAGPAWRARGDDTAQPESLWMAVGLTSWGLVTLHPELATDLVVYDAFWRGPLGPASDVALTLAPATPSS